VNWIYLAQDTDHWRGSCSMFFFLSLALQPSYGLLNHEVFVITHNDTPQSVGLLCTSDQLFAATSNAPGGIRTPDRTRRAVI
jgi:hypothetical protein